MAFEFDLKGLKEKRVLFALLLAILVSCYSHSLVFSEFHMPTFGNTMIHVASERHLILHEEYPMQDYSYGGTAPNLYVPLYRFTVASISVLCGISLELASQLLVMLIAILLPLGFYLLGKELFGEKTGVAAAFLCSAIPELLIYTGRPLPQAMGMMLLPIALWALVKEKKIGWLLGMLTVFTHQEAGDVFVFIAFGYGVVQAILKNFESAKNAFIAWFLGSATYLVWHFLVMGNLNILEMAQFKNHEGGIVTMDLLIEKSTLFILVLALIGAIVLLFKLLEILAKKRNDGQAKFVVFTMVWLAIGIAFTKNDLIGMQVFMDRFIVYLNETMVVLAAAGAIALVAAAENIERVSQRAGELLGELKLN